LLKVVLSLKLFLFRAYINIHYTFTQDLGK